MPAHQGRRGRPARRGRRFSGPRHCASLSRPRSVSGHGHLFDLLPLLHPLPHFRPPAPMLYRHGQVGKSAGLHRLQSECPRRTPVRRRPPDPFRRPAGMAAFEAQGDSPCGTGPHWHESPRGDAAAHYTVSCFHAEKVPSPLDEHSCHAPRRTDPGNERRLHSPCRCRHSTGQPDGIAGRHQRFRFHHDPPGPRTPADPRPSLLPVPVRPDPGLIPFPNAHQQRPGNHPGPARPYHGLCRADLRC